MKIIIAGKNNIAVSVTDWILKNIKGVDIYAVCNANDQGRDGFQRSFKFYCEKSLIPIISLEQAYNIDDAIFLSLEFDKIVLPSKFKHESIYNIHFSLLPKYKGMYTSAWPILNGECETGVTLHKIDHGIDTGPIISQRKIIIDEEETAKTLYLKYIKTGTHLVIDNINNLINDNYSTKEQASKHSTYYSQASINYKDLALNYKVTAYELLNQVKAFTFRDYQLPKIEGASVFHGEILTSRTEVKVGTIIHRSDEEFIVSTIDYDVVLYKDNFNEMLEACKDKTPDYIERLLRTDKALFEKNAKGWSPIIVAAYHGNVDVMFWLVSKGVDINDRNYNGTTVAMYFKNYMKQSGDYSNLAKLIEYGLDFYLTDNNGLTVFDYLHRDGDKFMIQYMMEILND